MAHWRNTFKPARLFVVDARVTVFLFGVIFYIRTETIAIFLAMAGIFYWFERYGYTFPAALRLIRRSLCSPIRPPLTPSKSRHPIDFGR